jgi:hypothetical protein
MAVTVMSLTVNANQVRTRTGMVAEMDPAAKPELIISPSDLTTPFERLQSLLLTVGQLEMTPRWNAAGPSIWRPPAARGCAAR